MTVYTLDEIIEITNGGSWTEAEYSDSEKDIYVVKVTNMVNGSIAETSNDSYLPESLFNKYKNHQLKFGDVCIATVGSHPSQQGSVVGRTIKVQDIYSGSFLNQNAAILRPKDGNILSNNFFYYLTKTIFFKHHVESRARGSANQVRMAIGELKKFSFNYPDIQTQKKVAAVLSAYDDFIENNKKRIQILENMAEELYKEWFVRFRFPNWENTAFEKGVPKGWTYTTLENLGKIRTGKTPSTSNSEFYDGEYPFYKTPDMHDKVFVFETVETLTEQGLNSQKSQIIEANEIMVTCIGSGGVTAISTKRGCTNQQINSLSVANKKFLYWAYYLIKYLKPQIELYGATGATMTNLSKGKFSNLEIIKPTDELIEKYFNLVSPKFEMIKKLSQMNQMLEEQKGSLLPRLISGKLSVEDLNIHFPPSMQE